LIFLPKSKEEKEKFDDIYEDLRRCSKQTQYSLLKLVKIKKKVKALIKHF